MKRWHHRLHAFADAAEDFVTTSTETSRRPSSLQSAGRRLSFSRLHTNWHLRRASRVIGQMR